MAWETKALNDFIAFAMGSPNAAKEAAAKQADEFRRYYEREIAGVVAKKSVARNVWSPVATCDVPRVCDRCGGPSEDRSPRRCSYCGVAYAVEQTIRTGRPRVREIYGSGGYPVAVLDGDGPTVEGMMDTFRQ